jgi:hypothetical protein
MAYTTDQGVSRVFFLLQANKLNTVDFLLKAAS